MMCYHYTSTSSLILRMLEATTIIVTTWYGERKADGPFISWSKQLRSAAARAGRGQSTISPFETPIFVLSRCYDT